MTRAASRMPVAVAAAAVALVIGFTRGEAHKPITSPYTFNEDVFPIVQDRCAACHVAGGVAPMSLLTHAEAVPWGESMRAELMAGHMPPWGLDSTPGRFRHVQGLTARELNVLLTWASGGTPAGDPAKAPAAGARERTWPLGTPDRVLTLPEVRVGEETQEHMAEFTVPAGLTGERWLRAVDLLPGTPALVRNATISIKGAASAAGGTTVRSAPEDVLAMWVPGDHPVTLDAGTGYHLPAGAELHVRVRYRKTWEYERVALTDASRIGLYFADAPAIDARALELASAVSLRVDDAQPLTFSAVLDEPLRALAIYPDADLANAAVRVTAVRPNGSREELIAFRPRAGWARRYWFRDPIALPRGTRIDVQARPFDEQLLPPGTPPPPQTPAPVPVRLRLTVVPAS